MQESLELYGSLCAIVMASAHPCEICSDPLLNREYFTNRQYGQIHYSAKSVLSAYVQ